MQIQLNKQNDQIENEIDKLRIENNLIKASDNLVKSKKIRLKNQRQFQLKLSSQTRLIRRIKSWLLRL